MDITKLLRTLFFVVFFATIFAVIIKNFYTRIPKDVVGLYIKEFALWLLKN